MLAAAFWSITSSATAGPYDPTFTFKSIVTPHFIVHFHQGEEQLAARLARIAERVHDAVVKAGSHAPSRRTHIILADQNDNANGGATVVPWNAIQIDATPPTGAEEIGNTDDWLEYVFTHEYAHICHLDRSRGWARAAKCDLRTDRAGVSEPVAAALADRRPRHPRRERRGGRTTALWGFQRSRGRGRPRRPIRAARSRQRWPCRLAQR